MRIIESLLAPQEHDGDVMDLHFIAHSRGVVVVTEALRVLTAQDNPLIKQSFIALTLLDPHPANNKYHPGSDTIGEFASGDLFFQFFLVCKRQFASVQIIREYLIFLPITIKVVIVKSYGLLLVCF